MNKINCFLTIQEGFCYLIPEDLMNKFEGTDYYDRYNEFGHYIIPDGVTIDDIDVPDNDIEILIDGEMY